MKKFYLSAGIAVLACAALAGCGISADKASKGSAEQTTGPSAEAKAAKTAAPGSASQVTIIIAAAASLETCLKEELIPMFEKSREGIKVQGTYDSSGKLQTQIEEGADVDVFFSAAEKQMNALTEKGLIKEGSVVKLLENKIVFIVPAGEESGYSSFEEIVKADSIALGDPESVPVGQYAKESLTNLGLWDQVAFKSSLGTNVTEVLNWVAEGSAKAGVVYATDAAQTDKVAVVAEAPEGSVSKAIYPAGIIKDSGHVEEAQAFVDFLKSDEAMAVFAKNGFAAAN